jgi:hypothetical protein
MARYTLLYHRRYEDNLEQLEMSKFERNKHRINKTGYIMLEG